MIGSELRGTIGRKNFYRTALRSTMSKFFYNMFLRNRGWGEGVVLFFMYLGFFPVLFVCHLLCSAICPSFRQLHAPTLGCSPLPHFHLSLSSIDPTFGISLFVRPLLHHSSYSSPSPHRHSILLVSLFVWHLSVLSFGSGLGLFFHTGTFLSLFSTLGMWILTCINPFLILPF